MSSASTSQPRIRHVPALDGLRGLALLGVLFFHANGALPGGYLGVDLFFVLSGYLITSLLLAEQRATGRIALSAFWVRRARRLFPALLSLMPAVAIYGRYLARPDELRPLRMQALAALAYVANWQSIFAHRSYWQLFSAPSPLEHTWSLSIEEQFYVVWPLLVAVLLRRFTKRALLGVSLALSALSMSAMWHLFDAENTTRVYLGTDTRMAGILLGAALATLLSPNHDFGARAARALDGLGVLALCGLGVAWCTLRGTNPWLYHGGFWLTECGALLLIACAIADRKSLVARLLAWRPFTLLGTISYGVYLWHWPVNVVLSPERVHVRGLALHTLHFAVTFAIAIVSYWLLERPIRRHGVPFAQPLLIVPAAVAAAVLLIVRATYAREVPVQLPPPPAPEAVRFRIMLFGDSTANSLGWALRGLAEKGLDVQNMGKDGCTLLSNSCEGPHWVDRVREHHPDVSVVYLGGAFLHGFHLKGDWQTACRPAWDRRFEEELTLRLRDLQGEAGEVFTATIPYALVHWESPEFNAQIDCVNRSIRKSAAAVPGVQLLDIGARLCPNSVCEQDVGAKEPIRPDGMHFSIDGAHGLARWVYEEIRP
ncbi:MAG: acyltransferase family protein [Polyangiaceae bacterium]